VSQSKIIVDLGTLTHVNSMGIKKWCEWLSAHQKVKQIWLIHVPYVFGRHLSVVKGMVEKNVWIRSIYVPFYSEKLKIREDSLFVHGVHYDDSRIIMMPEILDSEKNFMEIDIRVDTYFMFLKHLKELRQEE
jgi:hypothetical protein